MKEKNNEEVNLNETNKEESFAKYIYELRLKRNLTYLIELFLNGRMA